MTFLLQLLQIIDFAMSYLVFNKTCKLYLLLQSTAKIIVNNEQKIQVLLIYRSSISRLRMEID